MDAMHRLVETYQRETAELAASPSTTEASFYPAIQSLLKGVLREAGLPFEVRVHTSEHRVAGGADRPDLAFYDGAGDFAVVLGEVKTPRVEIAELAMSTERKDQIGRYLARTGVVLLSNVRGLGLLTTDPSFTGPGPVPPASRQLLEEVELWPSTTALRRGAPPPDATLTALAELIETAVTEFAPIAEPESLARILARLARRAKADLPAKFSRAVQPLLDDFATALGIHFVGEEGEEFLRSSLIQTAFYGLFAGWTLWRHAREKRPFRWEDLAEYLKIPFLGGLFHDFRHPRRLKELGLRPHLDRAQAALERVVVERFFARFGVPPVRGGAQPTTASSAILYFYEPFLEAFDPELRKQLGVWYTPQEIVHYQVRKVDRLLRDELDCPRGFADDRVVVLDPCCGTGAYLIEVLRCVAEQLESEGVGALLGTRLLDAFCRRILGFEILTAPFVVAQLQLYLILADLGVEPDETHRPAIFLTNALTGWEGPEQLKLHFPELQQEHDAAQRVKREEKIIVILGNPPYNRWIGAPVDEEADLVDHYKGIHRDAKRRQLGKSELYTRFGIRKHLLDDLYIRFFRLAETRIGERAEYGIVSFISNYSFLTGRSHPIMRESLLKNFNEIWIDSLNGDKYRTGKRIPKGIPQEGSSDQSVFTTEHDPRGIQVGVAITTMLKRKRVGPELGWANLHHRDFWGLSVAKRQALLQWLVSEDTSPEDGDKSGRPEGPRCYDVFSPSPKNRWRFAPYTSEGGFEDWASIDELFPYRYQGVNPARGLDGSVVETDRGTLEARMRDYFSDMPFTLLKAAYPNLCAERAEYKPAKTRKELLTRTNFRSDHIVPYHLFPFDLRFIYYETEAKLLTRRSPKLWENLQNNSFMIAVPEPRRISEARPLFATCLFDYHLHDRGSFGYPLHVRPEIWRDLFSLNEPDDATPVANLNPATWKKLREIWNLSGDLKDPEAKQIVHQLFHLTLAIGHAPQFDIDHKDSLAQDWIHLPIPKDREILKKISVLGNRVSLLLDPLADATGVLHELLSSERRHLGVIDTTEKDVVREGDLVVTVSYFGGAKGGWRERSYREHESPHTAWGSTTGDLFLNDTVHLANVPQRVWQYALGGYPVIKKWLGYRDAKRRPGRGLKLDEIDHLRSMVHRIAALLLLHEKLDAAYEQAIENPFTAEELGIG